MLQKIIYSGHGAAALIFELFVQMQPLIVSSSWASATPTLAKTQHILVKTLSIKDIFSGLGRVSFNFKTQQSIFGGIA